MCSVILSKQMTHTCTINRGGGTLTSTVAAQRSTSQQLLRMPRVRGETRVKYRFRFAHLFSYTCIILGDGFASRNSG